MSERWLQFCRRLVPPHLRETAFDPAVADLEVEWVHQGIRRRPRSRRLAVFAAALECRRLAARTRAIRTSRFTFGAAMSLVKDLAFAGRRLARRPGLTAIAVLTLTLGLGANLALFAFVDGILLAPIDVERPEDLVRVYPRGDSGGNDVVSYADYRAADAGTPSLDLATHAPTMAEIGIGPGSAVRPIELVSGNYFNVLRLVPPSGRLIAPGDDDAELAHPVAVISDAFWRAGFGGDPSIVGRTIRINGASFEVIGVAPAGFRGTYNAHVIDLWVPVTMQQIARPRGLTLDRRGWGWLSMIGRLESGKSIVDATRELDSVAADLDRRFPSRTKRAFTVTPAAAVAEYDRRNLQPVLVATFAFTALLFVVTCANLAGIMQSRLAARSLELAIRRSLGAGRVRLAWEWMTECVLIALAGGALGVVAARLTAGAIARMNLPTELLGDASFAVPIGPRVVLYALGLSLVAGVLFGAWPAWRASRLAAAVPLKHDSGSTIGGRHRAASRRLLVAVQMALSVVLLVAASLLVTSVGRQQAFDPGFPTDGLAMLTVNLQRQRVEPGSQRALADRALDVVRRQPGVRDADLGFRTPLSFGQDTLGFTIPGYVAGDGRPSVSIDFNAVGARYFETMGMRFVSGGAWDASAAATTIHAVVNETAARTYFGGADPAGRTIELRGEGPVTIAGVVRDTSYYEIGEAPLPYIYLSAESRLPSPFTIHVRLDDPARAGEVLPRLATALGSADARLSPYDVMTFDELRRVPLFPARMLAGAAGGFGLLALVLTAIGLYGVVSASVAQRTREIGLRLALGARPATVLKGILIEAGWLTLAGAAVGFAGGYLAATSLRSWLFTVSPFDAGAYAAVAVLLAGITLFAAWWPARRAAGIDPISALREG